MILAIGLLLLVLCQVIGVYWHRRITMRSVARILGDFADERKAFDVEVDQLHHDIRQLIGRPDVSSLNKILGDVAVHLIGTRSDVTTVAQGLDRTASRMADLIEAHGTTVNAIHESASMSLLHAADVDAHLTSLRARIDQGLLEQTPPDNSDDEIVEAVRKGCARAGINASMIEPSTDLAKTGRLHTILGETADILGQKMPLRTMQDITRFFSALTDDLHAAHR